MNKKTKEEFNLIYNVYMYARENALDTKQAIDIQKVLRIFKAKDSSIEHAELMVGMMDIFDRMVISEATNIGTCSVKH